MNTIILLLVYILIGILWAITSFTAAFLNKDLTEKTGKEFQDAKNKYWFFIKLGFEGPFVFLRLLKK